VNDEISLREKLGVSSILAGREANFLGQLTERQATGVWLMVRRVDDRDSVRFQPVAEGQRRMIQVLSCHANVFHGEDAFHEFVVADGGWELLEAHGEIRVLHLPGQGVLKMLTQPARRVDIPFIPGREKRGEEGEALDMVPVGVSDKEVAAHWPGRGGH